MRLPFRSIPIRNVLAGVLVLLTMNVAFSAEPRHLTPKPLLAIDCGYEQPCTGTVCVAGTSVHYCDSDPGTPVECEYDSQQYSGGDQICCTQKTLCDSCVYRGHNINYYDYRGESGACTPNP